MQMLMLMLLLLILDAAFRLEMSLKAYLAAALVGFMISLMIDGLVSGHHGLQVRPRRSAAVSVQELSLLLICALIVTSLVPGARTDAGAGSDSVKAPSAMRRTLVECADGSSHAVSSIDEMPDMMASRQTKCIIKSLVAAIHAGFHSPPAAALPLHDSPSSSAYYGGPAELAAEVTESAPLSSQRVAARGPPLSRELQGSAKVHAHETNGQTAARGEDKAEPSEEGQTATQPGDGALTHSPGVGPAIEDDATIGSARLPLTSDELSAGFSKLPSCLNKVFGMDLDAPAPAAQDRTGVYNSHRSERQLPLRVGTASAPWASSAVVTCATCNCACADRSLRASSESQAWALLPSSSYASTLVWLRFPAPLSQTPASRILPLLLRAPHHRPHRGPMQHACGLHDQHEIHVVHDARQYATRPRRQTC